MIDVPVERLTDRALERVTRHQPVPWQRYHRFRNDVLTALREFGTVGAMGEAPITDDADGPPRGWSVETDHPEFWVMDDQWDDEHLGTKVECEARFMTLGSLQALLKVTTRWKGATIGIALGEDA